MDCSRSLLRRHLWFALEHDRTLLLPFLARVVLVIALPFAVGIFSGSSYLDHSTAAR